MNMKSTLIGIVLLAIIGAGLYFIIKTPVVPAATNTTPTTQRNTSAQTANTASSSTQVQAQDISVGTGLKATPGSQVAVLYVGKLPDGTVFDSSKAHNDQPFIFTLGCTPSAAQPNCPIPGFQIGVNTMKIGGERLMAIPPTLGYGNNDVKDAKGKVVIPGNSTIVFDVKLIGVQPAGASTTTPVKTTK
jgi:FKBP-type peptidyl-prolyl cis-trans isomerase